MGGSGSITNTVIVSAGPGYTDTNPNNNISSDTDTIAAPVTPLVLAANAGILANNIGIDGAMPAGSLTALYGKAQTLEFAYNPSSTVSTATNTIGASTGLTPGAMAFIEISNNSNPFASNAQIYFEGTVSSGQKLYADASIDPLTNLANTGVSAFMSTTAGQGLFAFVFNSPADFLAGVAPVQTNTYNTSGSQAMALNDQIGSLKTIGYIGSTGGHLTS